MQRLAQGSRFGVVGALLVFLASGSVLLAGHEPPPRVAYLDGTAAYEPAGDVDWSEVTVNLPLLDGDRIFSHPGSRIEVEFGYENFVRVSEETDVVFRRVDSREVEIEVRLGDIILRLDDPSRFKIQVPGAVVRVKRRGLYRIGVDEAGAVLVSVRKGRLEVENQSRNRFLDSGEQLHIPGPGAALNQVSQVAYEDGFDLWSDRRDAARVTSRSVAYVGGGYIPGVYDLDRYGYWDTVAGYGHVWFPSVDVGWTPYRYGRWGRYPRWGWTWISYEPWGWLPYHYGSWYYYGPSRRWCWIPRFSFSAWSPALVSFHFGGGYVGWAPLGFGRGYGRGYGSGNTYVDNSVTVINETNITNIWRRPGRETGLTVVSADDFRTGGNSQGRFVDSPSRQLVENLRPGWPDELRSASGRGGATALVPRRSAEGARAGQREGARVVTVGGTPATGDSSGASTWRSPGRGSAPWANSESPAVTDRNQRGRSAEQVVPVPRNSSPQRSGTWRDRGSDSGAATPPAVTPRQNRSTTPSDSRWRSTAPTRNTSPAVRRPENRPTRQVTPARPPSTARPPASGDSRRWSSPSRPPNSSVKRPPSSPSRRVEPPSPSRRSGDSRSWTSPRPSSRQSARPPATTRSRVSPSRGSSSSDSRRWSSPRRSSGGAVKPPSSSRSRVAPRSGSSTIRSSGRSTSRPSVNRGSSSSRSSSRSSTVPARKPSRPSKPPQ